jgi:hypothetical protein
MIVQRRYWSYLDSDFKVEGSFAFFLEPLFRKCCSEAVGALLTLRSAEPRLDEYPRAPTMRLLSKTSLLSSLPYVVFGGLISELTLTGDWPALDSYSDKVVSIGLAINK